MIMVFNCSDTTLVDLRVLSVAEDVHIGHTVPLRSIRPSRVPGLGGLDEIGPRSQVIAHLAGVRIWFNN